MFHVELAPLGGILGPLKSDLGVFWAKIPVYPYNVKTQKMHFLKTLLWADFDLLESNSRYIFLHKNQKIYHSEFFSLDACSGPMWSASNSPSALSARAGLHDIFVFTFVFVSRSHLFCPQGTTAKKCALPCCRHLPSFS